MSYWEKSEWMDEATGAHSAKNVFVCNYSKAEMLILLFILSLN